MCRSVHSEQNAIISANRRHMLGATLYLVGINKRNGEYIADNYPCTLCKRMIINAGITRIVYKGDYPDELSLSMLDEAKVQLVKFGGTEK